MTDEQVMKMPARRFWLMSNNIHRIEAERDMRRLTLGSVSQSGEAAKDYRQQLERELGKVVEHEQELDRSGWQRLKTIGKGSV